ncbi:hypothetical protein D9M68_910470 [compost metagenome]
MQGGFGAIEQARLQKVERQRMLGAIAVLAAEVGAGQEVLVHPHRAVVVAPAAKQIAQREMQFGGVRVALHRFDEGVDGLVLLFIEQVVQSAEIGFGCLPAFHAPLAQVETGRAPSERECQRQAPKQPGEIKVHAGGRGGRE